jgi:hypothetical protein
LLKGSERGWMIGGSEGISFLTSRGLNVWVRVYFSGRWIFAPKFGLFSIAFFVSLDIVSKSDSFDR